MWFNISSWIEIMFDVTAGSHCWRCHSATLCGNAASVSRQLQLASWPIHVRLARWVAFRGALLLLLFYHNCFCQHNPFFALLIPCVRSIISICQTCVLDWTSTAFIGPRVSKLSLFSLLFFRLHTFLFQTAISHHNVLFPSLNVTQIMVLYFILPPNLIVWSYSNTSNLLKYDVISS